MSLEEAGVALSSEEFATREKGDEVIRRAKLEDYDEVAKLAQSSDPEVADRAHAALPIIRLDLDPELPAELKEKFYNLDRLTKEERGEALEALASRDDLRPTTMIALHSYWLEHPLLARQGGNREESGLIEVCLSKGIQVKGILPVLDKLHPERYERETLGKILNTVVRQTGDKLDEMLPMYVRWSKAHTDLTESLDSHGYRLEIAQQSSTAPNRTEALRRIVTLGAGTTNSRDRLAAIRRQLVEYRDVALTFPTETLDLQTGWFFYDVMGGLDGLAFLDGYCAYRKRFAASEGMPLAAQPLEALRVLREDGPSAAMDFAMGQSVHGGVGLLAEWFVRHPELITEPLPLPDVAKGADFTYRPLKFVRIFAPYLNEEELAKQPKIAAAVKILKQDSKWVEAFRQAQPAIAQDRESAAKRKNAN
jgi:hypothetical protein